MGSILQGTNNQSLCRLSITTLLEYYSYICTIQQEYLGKLQLYRKKQFNYDYLALLDKIVQGEQCGYLGGFVQLALMNRRNFVRKQLQGVSNSTDGIWLKVLACEVYGMGNTNWGNNYKRVKLCIQYLNYTVKDYLTKPPKKQYKSLPNILYILSQILNSFLTLKQHYQSHKSITQPALVFQQSQINLQYLITNITTPNMIYINTQGCIKLLSIPILIYNDYITSSQQCIGKCCQWQQQNSSITAGNVVVNKYGRYNVQQKNSIDNKSNINNDSNDRKSSRYQKIFLTKYKKLIRYIKKQIQQEKCQTNQNITTHIVLNNIHGNKKKSIPNINNINNINNNQQQFWIQLQKCNTTQAYIQYYNTVNNIPTCLQLVSNKQQVNKVYSTIPAKQQKIKLDKYGSDKLHTTNDSLVLYRNSNKNKKDTNLNNQYNGNSNCSSTVTINQQANCHNSDNKQVEKGYNLNNNNKYNSNGNVHGKTIPKSNINQNNKIAVNNQNYTYANNHVQQYK